MKQKIKWAKSSVFMSLLAMLPFIGMAVAFIEIEPSVSILFCALLALMCFLALWFFPMSIEIDRRVLTVVFSLRIKQIPIEMIKKAVPYKLSRNTMRVCGSGAFFGWWGWFRNKELGRFMMYAGNLDKLIYVELINGKKYVFSCDDPQTMAAAVLDARGFSADALQR